eukprot:Opistho-1_new@79729
MATKTVQLCPASFFKKTSKAGTLQRDEGGKFRKRWCVVDSSTFAVHKDEKDAETMVTLFAEDVSGFGRVPPEKLSEKGPAFAVETREPKAVHVFKCASEDEANEWLAALRLAFAKGKPRDAVATEFVAIEAFVLRGIRVDGMVEPQVLAKLSGEGQTRKTQDGRGWFCDRFLPVPEVINLMVEYVWELSSASYAESVTPTEKLAPCHMLMFRRART